MTFKDKMKTALKNLAKRKLRTFLTSFAITIGTMLIITMVSLGVGLQDMVIDQIKQQASVKQLMVMKHQDAGDMQFVFSEEEAEKLQEEREKNAKKFGAEEIKKIKNIQGVEDIQVSIMTHVFNITIDGKDYEGSMATGFDPNYTIFPATDVEAVRSKEKNQDLSPILSGRNLEKDDTTSVLLGQKYLDRVGINNYESLLNKKIRLICSMPQFGGTSQEAPYIIEANVAGIIHEKFNGSDSVVMPLEMAASIQGYYQLEPDYLKNNGPDNLTVYAKNLDDVENISKEIKAMGFGVMSYKDVVSQVKLFFRIFEGVLAIGGIIVLFVASLGVINTMTMAIYERTRSIGIMKALGASKKAIRHLFIVESGMMGLIGGVFGILSGWLNTVILGFALNQWLKTQGSTEAIDIFSIPLWLVLGGILFSVVVSVVAGLYPAFRASRLDPIQALKYE